MTEENFRHFDSSSGGIIFFQFCLFFVVVFCCCCCGVYLVFVVSFLIKPLRSSKSGNLVLAGSEVLADVIGMTQFSN